MMIKDSRQYLRLTIDTAALALCIYQIAFMLNYIIRGETRTRLKISNSAKFYLPDIYLCFSIYDLINVTYFQSRYPTVSIYRPGQKRFAIDPTALKLLSEMKVNELMKSIKDPNRIISSIHPAPAIDDIYQNQVTSSDCTKTNNLIGTLLCVTISCSKNGSAISYDRNIVERGEASGQMMMVKFDPYLANFSTSVSVMIVPWKKIVNHKSENSLFFDFYSKANIPFEMIFSFKRLKTSYSQSDFFDQCTDYKAQGFLNKIDKISQCLSNLTREKLDCPFNGVLQPLDQQEQSESKTGLFQIYLEYLTPENETKFYYHNLFSSFEAQCKNLAPYPDCDDTMLKPTQNRIIYRQSNNQSMMVIRMPSTPTLSNIVVPYYDIDDLIVYTQSAIGIWLGISPMVIIDWLIDWITNTLNNIQDENNDQE